MEPVKPIDADAAAKALAAALADTKFAPYAALEPYLERVPLFKGSMLLVKFKNGKPTEGGERPFYFQKAVVSEYRRLTGET
jgi:hypothetical protein